MLTGFWEMIGASLLLGSIPAASKYLLLNGMTPGAITFFTFIIYIIGSATVILIKGEGFHVNFKQLIILLLVGGLGMGSTGYLLNMAYSYIPVGLTTMIHFSYPCIVVLIMSLVFKEKMNSLKVIAIASGICGMMLIVDPRGNLNPHGIILAFCSSLTYSIYIVANDKGVISSLPQFVKLFYFSIGAVFLAGIQTVNHLVMPVSIAGFLLLFVLCGGGGLIAFFLLIDGIHHIGATPASFLNMLEPITSVVVSWLVYREPLSALNIAGCLLVITAMIFAAAGSKPNHNSS